MAFNPPGKRGTQFHRQPDEDVPPSLDQVEKKLNVPAMALSPMTRKNKPTTENARTWLGWPSGSRVFSVPRG